MGTVAKVLAGVGAAILLLSGACFLFVGQALGGDAIQLFVVGAALIVGGVLLVVWLLGARRPGGPT